MKNWLQKLKIDRFLMLLIGVIVLASVLPVQGAAKVGFEHLTTAAIALLFFMHGAKLSREAIKQGMGHWRLPARLCCFRCWAWRCIFWCPRGCR